MPVRLCNEINPESLTTLLDRYDMEVHNVNHNEAIPGSFWQPPEAGLVGNKLYIRNDTPVHSALHEACHYICMDKQRRENLDTNAGGDYEEEDAVCYLQILLAELIPEIQQERMLNDMDAWGYSFRLGSAKAWFENDAEDALAWLQKHNIVNHQLRVTFSLRT